MNTLDTLLLFTDLGNYLYLPVHEIPEVKWKDMENIALCDMVDDILHTDNYAISEYYHTTFKSRDEALYKNVDLPRLKS